MDTVYESQMTVGESESQQSMLKAKSAPISPLKASVQLKPKISAPSYLLSFRENPAPPFKTPDREPKVHLLTGTLVMEDDVIEMIAAFEYNSVEGLKKFLEYYLVKTKIVETYNLSEKMFLVSLVIETIDYGAQRNFPAPKLACLLSIYLCTHKYFKWYYWSTPIAIWAYFKENMIRHTIEDSPYGEEIFQPEECYDIVSHFHTIYLSNLPLVHIQTFGVYRFKLLWTFKPK